MDGEADCRSVGGHSQAIGRVETMLIDVLAATAWELAREVAYVAAFVAGVVFVSMVSGALAGGRRCDH